MKKTLTFFLILCFITSSFAQKSFEGEVLYSVNAISNTPKLSSEQLNALLGNVMHYYMKGADYKSTFNGKMGQCQIYIDKDKNYMQRYYQRTVSFGQMLLLIMILSIKLS